jgi:hypothetical protein
VHRSAKWTVESKQRRGASGGANGPTARCVGNRFYGNANMQLPKESNGARAAALDGVALRNANPHTYQTPRASIVWNNPTLPMTIIVIIFPSCDT